MTLAIWTDERVEQLKKLWQEGLSASQIAAAMGGVSRNAVIGKVHRLGLAGRVKPVAPPTGSKAVKGKNETGGKQGMVVGNTALKAEANTELAVQSAPQSAGENVLSFNNKCSIMDLRESSCRWPLGDPTKSDFRYCGSRSDGGTPYCTYHGKMAYQSAPDRNRQLKRVSFG
jgi:GcrA cell cycle regulator